MNPTASDVRRRAILRGLGGGMLVTLAGCAGRSVEADTGSETQTGGEVGVSLPWDRYRTESVTVVQQEQTETAAAGAVLWHNPEVGVPTATQMVISGCLVESDPETLSFISEEPVDLGRYGTGLVWVGETVIDGSKRHVAPFAVRTGATSTVGLAVTTPEVYEESAFDDVFRAIREDDPTASSDANALVLDSLAETFEGYRSGPSIPMAVNSVDDLCGMFKRQHEQILEAIKQIGEEITRLGDEADRAIQARLGDTDAIMTIAEYHRIQIDRLRKEANRLGQAASVRISLYTECRNNPVAAVDRLHETMSLADHVYDAFEGKPAPDGWKTLPNGMVKDPKTGFQAAAYENETTGEIVISYAGTDVREKADVDADFSQGIGDGHPQYRQAVEFAKRIQAEHPETRLRLTGHSLGGGLAESTALQLGYEATVFNPAGVHDNTLVKSLDGVRLGEDVILSEQRSKGLVTGISTDGDILTTIQDRYNENPLLKFHPLNPLQNAKPGALPKTRGFQFTVSNQEKPSLLDRFASWTGLDVFGGFTYHSLESMDDGLSELKSRAANR